MIQDALSLEELHKKMIKMLDEERKRISADLHDSIQNKICLLRDKYKHLDPRFESEVQTILDGLQQVAYQLTPKNLQDISLKDYLKIYTLTLNKTYLFKTSYKTNISVTIPKKIEEQLFMIVQESISNIVKHAQDTCIVIINYYQQNDKISLSIRDYGDGFDEDTTIKTSKMGLRSMETRCKDMGATCNITSNYLEGTKVEILLPVPVEKENETITEMPMAKSDSETSPTMVEPSAEKTNIPFKNILIVDNQVEYTVGLNMHINYHFRGQQKIISKHTVKEAETFLENIVEPIDILILDISLPDESGLKFVKKVMQKHHNIKVILHTMHNSPAYIYQAKKVLKIPFYIWKESARLAGDKHPLIYVLENWGTLPTYYSPEIEQIAQSFEEENSPYYPKEHPNSELQKQELFAIYVRLLKKNEKATDAEIEAMNKRHKHTKGDKLTSAKLEKMVFENKVAAELALKIDKSKGDKKAIETIDRYFRDYKPVLPFDDKSEIRHLLIQLSQDLGLID